MKAVMAVCVYLLIGGLLAGGIGGEAQDNGEDVPDESLMFVVVAWPAVIGMVFGGLDVTYSRSAER